MSPTSRKRRTPRPYPASQDDILHAQRDGMTAAFNGHESTVCPWRTADTDRDRFLQKMWVRGYVDGRDQLRQARTAN